VIVLCWSYIGAGADSNAVWSNFEIADMDFFRSKVYTEFFEHLDASGGFYYEVSLFTHFLTSYMNWAQRWGDAPVHSIAVSLFLPKSAIHFFDRIGYAHPLSNSLTLMLAPAILTYPSYTPLEIHGISRKRSATLRPTPRSTRSRSVARSAGGS
jgi:hypothetical protein